jgi:hypothetical protein
MARTHRDQPRQLTSAWPDVPSEDPVGEVARQLALNLQTAIGDRSLRSIASLCGVTHVTIAAILAGKIWPDTATLARLELGIDADLWPGKAE